MYILMEKCLVRGQAMERVRGQAMERDTHVLTASKVPPQ
jgi:hypothetical protein